MDILSSTASYWSAGGWLLLPLAGVCVGIWGYFFRSRGHLQRVIHELSQIEQNLKSDSMAESSGNRLMGSFINRVLRDVESGIPPRRAFSERQQECMDFFRCDVTVLSALTAVAPLIGLMGTVMGMIGTFEAVANVSGNTGVEVAGGISQALITTQFGLVIAVPGVFGISRLRAMLQEVEVSLSSLRACWLSSLPVSGAEKELV